MKRNSAYNSPQMFDLGAIEQIRGCHGVGWDGGSGSYYWYE
jgi:hypothetical protein